MKYIRLFSLVFILLMGMVSSHAQNNTISIPDVSVAKGASISLPLYMDNTADVVAIQFTLTVPDGLTLVPTTATLTDRSDEHSVTLQSVGSNKYMAMVFSSRNNAIKGRTGKLLTVSLTASNSLEEGTEHQLSLSDVVIGARDGSNLATGFSAGKVAIAKSPDFEVSQVVGNETNVNPGGKVNVNWTVSNVGGLPTTGGWSEQILLKADDGKMKLLGTLYCADILNVGSVVSRSAEVNIPAIVGMDGDCSVVVRLLPNSKAGEPSWLQENNISQTESTISVGKVLSLSPENASAEETDSKPVRYQLSRSGKTTSEEVFSLTSNMDSRIVLPESVTIEEGKSSAYFYAQVAANGMLDNDSIVKFSISGNDYPEISSILKIEDDTYPSLSISSTSQEVTEGGNIVFSVGTQRISQHDIEVKMTCDFASRFKIPSRIVIPAGQVSIDVNVEAVEDDVPNTEEVVTFKVAAAKHNTASINTVLVDNDVPTLQLQLTPAAVSEAAGPLAVTARISRTDNIDKLVTVKLSDDSDGGIYYGQQTVVLEKGVKEATVSLGPIDNTIVDGERTYNISAAVWIASCSCNANNATSGGVVAVPLTVYDNDGPALSLTSASSVLKEGGEMTITVKRNTDTTHSLLLNIESDHQAALNYPATVTIPAGEAAVSFVVKSKGNDTADDSFTAIINAKADGYAIGNLWLAVSDQTLPDAQIESLSAGEQEYISGDNITFSATISNRGNSELPANTLVQLYRSDSQSAVAEIYTSVPVAAGQTQNVNIVISSPNSLGDYNYYAKVNSNKAFKELDYNNNSSSFAKTRIVSPFSTSTEVSKAIIKSNEEVEISGKVSGRNIADADIDVYVINKGYRHVIATRTDADGSFSVKYTPFESQTGHFAVGSCYRGDRVETEQCSFDIYAIDVKNNSLTCDILKGDSHTSKFVLTNNGVLPLTNVKAKLVSELPNVEVTYDETPVTIAGGERKDVAYTIKGIEVSPEVVWQTLQMEFTCDEGAVSSSDINYYIRSPKAKLKCDAVRINTSVTIGDSREYRLKVSNIGKAETGTINFALPSWMCLEGMQTVNSLGMGENADVVLLISTTDEMHANETRTGVIAINCEHGDGISIPYSVEPVSSHNGILKVDVRDEYTYYTEEAPHLSGAQVVLRHPTKGTIVASGTTDDNGIFEMELPEGYYALSVTADNHEGDNLNIYVEPERTSDVIVDLGYIGITCKWEVKETEIEDRYELVTKVKYETNVPVPCVVLGLPEKIDGDNMRVGESTLVYMTVTNKGLITALNNTVHLPENTSEWQFESLVSLEPFDLAPQQSVVLPVRITRLSDGSQNNSKGVMMTRNTTNGIVNDIVNDALQNTMNNFQNCMVQVRDTYEALCGSKMRDNESIERMAMKMCGTAAYGATIINFISGFFGASGATLGNPIGQPAGADEVKKKKDSETTTPVVTEQSFNMCDTCDAKKAEGYVDALLEMSYLGKMNEGLNEAYDVAKNHSTEKEQMVRMTKKEFDALKSILEETGKAYLDYKKPGLTDKLGLAENVTKIIKVVQITTEQCPPKDDDKTAHAKGAGENTRGWQEDYEDAATIMVDYLRNHYNYLLEIYGDETWFNTDFENKQNFVLAVSERQLTDEQVLELRPASVTDEQALALYRRINGLDEHNAIDFAHLYDIIDENEAMDAEAVQKGYASLFDRFSKTLDVCIEKFSEKSSSVCASISLQFTQQMVMTRQAFRGTLTVFNGNDDTAMTDVKLNLTVKDEEGNVATSHEFQINLETLNGFNGNMNLEEGWVLNAQQTGVATILFIPTKYAATMEEKFYSFGGSLSYVDPFTGLTVTRNLAPVTLTVKPSPDLNLTYFMQRDIKGDDPLTEEIEQSEEAEFSLLISNVGYGDAKNVRMFTEQPKIVDNEKGLLIDFELMSSQLNGGDKSPAIGENVATEFGTIPAKGTSYAQWWFKSSLLGHFIDYDVEATHVTSYDNPDLSLLNDVTIHELIRSLDVEDNNGKLVGFMTNDIADAEDIPDMLYLSNGEIETVSLAQNVAISKVSDMCYAMTVSASHNGWNYGSIADPTYGASALKTVIRQSDGKEMSLRNFWLTDRTLRDGKDPLYENGIHFADNIMSANTETYILTFEPLPELVLDIASVEGIPEEGSLSVEPLNNVKVMFNKYIDPATFTADDISLAVQGVKQDVSMVTISSDDNKNFMLDFSALNENIGNGYFVLSLYTSDVKDIEGFAGKNGKQVSWIMYRDGLVSLNAAAYPAVAGTIQKLSESASAKASGETLSDEDSAPYGSTIQLITVPNDGYEFKNWTVNGEMISTTPSLEYVALGDMDVKANYVPKTYTITISESSEGGAITGAATGVYSYGDILNLVAVADDDYVFDGWEVNNQNKGNENELSVVVDGVKSVKASFRRDVFQQTLTLSRGWNWISSYVSEPVPVSIFQGNASHIVGQYDEIGNGPADGVTGAVEALLPGAAYKVNASYSSTKSFKGRLHDLSQAPIALHAGWNWISYPYLEEKEISDVLLNASEGDCLVSQFGFSQYADGYWEGTLNCLTPGYGYLYKSATDKSLEFDFSDKQSGADASNVNGNSEEYVSGDVDARKYSSTMNIVACILSEAGSLDAEKCYIYAFAGSECRGKSRCVGDNHYLTIYGDDATNITFVVENTSNGDTFLAKETVTFDTGVMGSRKTPFTITVNEATAINSITESSCKMKIYSIEGVLINPEATAESLRKLNRGMYIIDGQKFMVK